MDGGGRFLQPMTAPSAGTAVARAPSQPSPAFALPFRLPRLKRRRSVAVPLERRLPRFLGTGLTLGFFSLVTFTGLSEGGHLDETYRTYGEPHHALARLVGLGLERVTISGMSQISEGEVLAAAGLNPLVSLPFLSASTIRERLERVPLIKSASVRKLYPNELVVTLAEREPHAIWQLNGELFVTAVDGTVLELMDDARFAHLPLVVGEQANTRTKEYLALLEAAGPLRSRIRAGTLVAGRRWTLKIDNGMDVRLPELGAAQALARLAKLEREQRILDKDVLAIDLRMPDRVVVRLTEEAAAARADAMKKKPLRGKGVDT
ncbi:MAG TPA: cell division protein FtsQ/DivIB [Microvirga sp.]|nr:cell division protein FtsQ/DivIB [Microvirga sp.]